MKEFMVNAMGLQNDLGVLTRDYGDCCKKNGGKW